MTNIKRAGILVVFQLFFLCPVFSQTFNYTPECLEAMKLMGKLKLEPARAILTKEQSKQPTNLAIDYLLDCIEYYALISSRDKRDVSVYEKNQRNRIDRIHKLAATIPLSAYAEAEMLLHLSIVKMMHQEYVSGAMELRSAYQLHTRNAQKYPQLHATFKSLGFIKALLGTLPENYHWVLNVVGLTGNYNEGINLIEKYFKQASATEPFIDRQQADFYYTLLQFYFGDKQQAWTYAQQHTTDFEDNNLSCYLRAFMASHTAHNEEALAALQKRPKTAEFSHYHELDWLMGYSLLNKLDPDCEIEFKKFVTFSKYKTQRKDAYRRLAWSELIKQDTLRFIVYRNLSFKESSYKDDEDLMVDKELARNIYPNAYVLKARLLFDGGYYAQAEQLIKSVQLSQLKNNIQKAEYYYRYGRIMQEQKKYAKAIEYFTESIKLSEPENLYFAPYSSLQLGSVYHKLGYTQTAAYYLKKAIAYKNYKAKGYIVQKAGQELEQLQ